MQFRRQAGLVLCTAGFLLVGYGVYEAVAGRIYQAWRGRQLDRVLNELPAQPQTAARRVAYQTGSAIGRLEIPRLGISAVVLEGSDTETLRLGIGRLHNSALPGEPGNVVLAGHRDTFFRPLRQVHQGDRISLRTSEGTFPYIVEWTKVVDPDQIDVLMPTPEPSMTLVTCYPFYYIGSAPQRFIVRAIPQTAAPVSTVSAPVATVAPPMPVSTVGAPVGTVAAPMPRSAVGAPVGTVAAPMPRSAVGAPVGTVAAPIPRSAVGAPVGTVAPPMPTRPSHAKSRATALRRTTIAAVTPAAEDDPPQPALVRKPPATEAASAVSPKEHPVQSAAVSPAATKPAAREATPASPEPATQPQPEKRGVRGVFHKVMRVVTLGRAKLQ